MNQDLELHGAGVLSQHDLAVVDLIALVLEQNFLDERPVLQLHFEEVGQLGEALLEQIVVRWLARL